MGVERRVISGLYRDSVSLMQCASKVQNLPGVEQAGAMMATEANLDLAREAGLLGSEESVEAGPNDVLLLVKSGEKTAADAAFEEAERILKETARPVASGAEKPILPRSIAMAVDDDPESSLALISTPGEYAASEAEKALKLGLDVMVFSDNVEVDDEVRLKRFAHEQGLLVMGPDCGTAIVGGVALGFANVVARGSIGCVGAAGTGLQQVTSLIGRWGAGVSHALGTGSHDLTAEVGGITMLDGLAALAEDPDTDVLLLVSKPPSADVAEKVLQAAAAAQDPAIVCFLGADPTTIERPGITAARTLDEAAALAVEAATGASPPRADMTELERAADHARSALADSQRYIRGLYSGGTFGFEAALILTDAGIGQIHANTPARPEDKLEDVWKSVGHTVVDLGDDVFTRGRPHPMIDLRLRLDRIAEEAADPDVAVVLLDIVLGYGSHPDPASEIAPAIKSAIATARQQQRAIAFVASVCGTDGDPQGLAHTEELLREAGVILAESNAEAVRLAARIVSRPEGGVR